MTLEREPDSADVCGEVWILWSKPGPGEAWQPVAAFRDLGAANRYADHDLRRTDQRTFHGGRGGYLVGRGRVTWSERHRDPETIPGLWTGPGS